MFFVGIDIAKNSHEACVIDNEDNYSIVSHFYYNAKMVKSQ